MDTGHWAAGRIHAARTTTEREKKAAEAASAKVRGKRDTRPLVENRVSDDHWTEGYGSIPNATAPDSTPQGSIPNTQLATLAGTQGFPAIPAAKIDSRIHP
jgi:hypothetical protein